jgi:phenylacetate-CoA ligase
MAWLDAGEARARSWLGSSVGQRRIEVRCRPVGVPQAISAAILNTGALHAPAIADPGVVERLARSIERSPPTMVWGVSNALYSVALALIEHGARVPVGACVSGGNHLHPHYREAMEAAFACRVFERYATMETGVVAHECPEAGALHVPAEGLIVEIVAPDGTPVAPGKTGDVLVTTLRNRATPLVRYRVGDRAVAPPSPQCRCGRGLPVFGSVAGRATDVLVGPGGIAAGPREVVEAVRPGLASSIVDVQVEQDVDGRMIARLVQRPSPHAQADRARAGEALRALVGAVEPLRVERVDHIALTPGGKLRTVVSRMTRAA